MSNVLSFVGNLGADAEVRYLPSGMAVLSFSVAMGSGYGEKAKTDWVRVSMFGKQAEGKLKDYLLKGTAVFVSGESSLNVYQANDGTTKAGINLIANFCNLVGKKGDTAPSQPQKQTPPRQNAPNFVDDPYDDAITF